MASIEFDEVKAGELQVQLGACIGEVNASLDSMGKEVANIKDWWKGGSEDGFIENFNGTKTDIQKALNQCAEEYKQLVSKVVDIKKQSEINIANQLRK